MKITLSCWRYHLTETCPATKRQWVGWKGVPIPETIFFFLLLDQFRPFSGMTTWEGDIVPSRAMTRYSNLFIYLSFHSQRLYDPLKLSVTEDGQTAKTGLAIETIFTVELAHLITLQLLMMNSHYDEKKIIA